MNEQLVGKLNEILNDPKAMEQMNALAQMLGAKAPAPQETSAVPVSPPAQNNSGLGNLSSLAGLLGGGAPSPKSEQLAVPSQSSNVMQTMMQVLPLLNSVQQDDDATRLLHSLRPLLGEERRRKLDEVMKLMKIFRLLPLLQGRGIL